MIQRKVIRVHIISSLNKVHVNELINEYLEKGYELHGDIIVTLENYLYYTQMMVMYEKNNH